MRRSIDATLFRETASKCAGMQGVELLETAFRSGSVIIIKYLLAPSGLVARQHEFFGQLFQALPELQAYIARCLAINIKTGEIPATLSTYNWDKGQLALLLRGEWEKLDFVNAPGGYFGRRDLEFCTTTARLSPAEHYIVKGVFNSILGFAEALFTSIGLSTSLEDGDGYTFRDLVEKQTEYLDIAYAVADQERASMLEWADTQFRLALGRAAQHFFTTFNTATPAEARLTAFLPPSALYFAAVDGRIKQLAPIAQIRSAFGMGGALVGISGTSTASVALAPALASPPASAARKALAGGGGSVAHNGAGGRSAPGAAVDIVKMLPNNQLYLAGSVYDFAAIAKMCKTDVNSHCWPVILSKKPGNAALSLCPHHLVHGGMSSKMHKKPANFNPSHINDHVQQAIQEQRIAAGGAGGGKRRKF